MIRTSISPLKFFLPQPMPLRKHTIMSRMELFGATLPAASFHMTKSNDMHINLVVLFRWCLICVPIPVWHILGLIRTWKHAPIAVSHAISHWKGLPNTRKKRRLNRSFTRYLLAHNYRHCGNSPAVQIKCATVSAAQKQLWPI